MLRLQSKTGWWLVTHVDHAHLAGAFRFARLRDTTRASDATVFASQSGASHHPDWAQLAARPEVFGLAYLGFAQ